MRQTLRLFGMITSTFGISKGGKRTISKNYLHRLKITSFSTTLSNHHIMMNRPMLQWWTVRVMNRPMMNRPMMNSPLDEPSGWWTVRVMNRLIMNRHMMNRPMMNSPLDEPSGWWTRLWWTVRAEPSGDETLIASSSLAKRCPLTLGHIFPNGNRTDPIWVPANAQGHANRDLDDGFAMIIISAILPMVISERRHSLAGFQCIRRLHGYIWGSQPTSHFRLCANWLRVFIARLKWRHRLK